MNVRFAKYQGLGNDFLVVDLRTAAPELAAAVQDPERVRALCDRQFGVGGDGVLAVLPAVTAGAHARMRVLNADGSEAEMCGNGIRCVAKELHDRLGVRATRLVIDTGAGPLACELQVGTDGRVSTVTVAMGAPRLTRGEIPMTGPAAERCVEQKLDGLPVAVTAVSMGNPHAIAFVGSRDEAYRLATAVGPDVERHAAFPRRTNSEFAFVKSRTEIDLVVWERGCGITLACGTGACATTVAAALTGRTENQVRVNLPGGALDITVTPENVFMRGPAALAFDGELELDRLVPRPQPGAQ